MPARDFADQIAAAARDLSAETVETTLAKTVALCIEMIEGCDAAGVTLVERRRKLTTPASTSAEALHADQLQYQLDEGPCIDAVWEHGIVESKELASEDRWPTWAPQVMKRFGARSMLCVQLFTTTRSLGAMNMYSRSVDGFAGDNDRRQALRLAAHVSAALRTAQEIEGLRTALDRRTTIGQAEGILMERFGLSAQQAFAVLQRVSQDTNTKLHAACAELVRTRLTPRG